MAHPKLPVTAKKAIAKRLTDLRAILKEDDDGYFHLEELEDEPTPAETIQKAWSRGYVKFDRFGHIHLLTTTRIEMNWDYKALRRKSEDHLRKNGTIGDIVRLSIELGVSD